jgi:hypothetical protein
MYLNDKLYVRHNNSEGWPFKLVDPTTLEEIVGEELDISNSKIKSVKRTDESGRNDPILEWT